MQADSIDETLRRRFESAWVAGHPEPIERFLPPEEDPRYLTTLEELVHIDLEFVWKSWSKISQGTSTGATAETIAAPPLVENYLERFPRLNQPEILLRLLQQECLARKQSGEGISVEEYRRRFPELAAGGGELESLIRTIHLGTQGTEPTVPTVAGSPGGHPTDETRPVDFGNYELLEEIGRGGMGIVYRARQRSADRIVALKVIRGDRLASMPRDSQTNAMDRFRHEVQAAARLEHEHIVTLYEVGEVDGEPFFSMRYVEGRSLAEILREGPISNRSAAAYMEPVARALEEAHGRGILHRDLKPQNILVDSNTDHALVTDFGLAKLSEDNEELTRAGEVMGTPPYMSPEQARDSSQVTAQTDVYALGATLYHILTGRPPFQAATGVETLRQVIDEEPALPRQLNPSIDRDLETICTKCLQKEPSRRYGSAELLANDLRRYLHGEPILARPIGTLGRTWRWCRRNPVIATLVGSTAAFLVLALAATAVGYLKTSAALKVADAAQKRSEVSFRQAREVVDDFYTRVSEDTLLNQPGMQPLRRELLREALGYYQRFLSQRGDDPTIRDELALTHFRGGRITEEVDSPETALGAYRRALSMQKQLVAQSPNDRKRLKALGDTFNAIGRVLHLQQKLDEALVAHQKAVEVRGKLARAAPWEAEFKRTLANSCMNIGLIERESQRPKKARRMFLKAQRARRDILHDDDDPEVRRDLGKGCYNLAVLSLAAGDYKDARTNLQEAIALFEKLLLKDPQDLANQYRLVLCYRILADLKSRLADRDSAKELYQKALGRMETLARSNPKVAEYQVELASLHMNFGELLREQEHLPAALVSFRQALDILQDLVTACPGVPEYRRDLAVMLRRIAQLQRAAGQDQSAREDLQTAKEHLAKLVEQFPNRGDFAGQLKQTLEALGALDTPRDQED